MKREKFNKEYHIRYNSGESIWSIANSENSTYKKVFEGIFDRRFEAKLLPEEEKQAICQKYLTGISTVQLGKEYGVGHKCIIVVLEEKGIKRDSALSERKYFLNENYFDNIDTPNKAYVLGLLYSDGNNCKTKGTIRIQLQEADRDILEQVKNELSYTKELTYIDCSKRVYGNGYTSKNMYSLDVYSSHMCNQLEKLGVIPNKSLLLTFPHWLDDNYLSHFIRGYMDGDGSISKKCYQISLTSTEDFCLSVQSIIYDKLGIVGHIDDASCHNGITKVYRLGKFSESKPFLDYIYKDAKLFLKRKYYLYLTRFVNNVAMNNTLLA